MTVHKHNTMYIIIILYNLYIYNYTVLVMTVHKHNTMYIIIILYNL